MGATGTIGKATAIKISELGAKVVISAKSEEKLNNVFSLLNKNASHRYLSFDLQNLSQISDFINKLVEFDGHKFDGLVYSVGTAPIIPLKNTTYDILNNVMVVNFFSFVELVRCFSHKKISNPNASIVALSSYSSINPDIGRIAYAASKGAMDSSIIAMAKELHKKNIRVNAIRPAVVDDGIRDFSPRVLDLVNMMKTDAIDPKNLAEHIAFLLSDASSGVYGRCFDVRGYL